MRLLKHFMALACCFSLHAEELILDTSDEKIVIQIDQDDSFLTILEWIRDQFKTPKQIREENEMLAFYEELTFDLASLDRITVSKTVKQKVFRNYSSPLAKKEREDISYILKTLNNHTFMTLGPHRAALKKAGDRVDHVHPFRFLECIFTEPELVVCVSNIQGKTFIWSEFLKGITTSFKEEMKRNNVPQEQLIDFAANLGVDVNAIYPSYYHNQWEEFVNILIQVVPRNQSSDRYNI